MRILNSSINWKIKFRNFSIWMRHRVTMMSNYCASILNTLNLFAVSHTHSTHSTHKVSSPLNIMPQYLVAARSKHIVSMNSRNEFSQSALLSCWCTSLAVFFYEISSKLMLHSWPALRVFAYDGNDATTPSRSTDGFVVWHRRMKKRSFSIHAQRLLLFARNAPNMF